MEVHTINNIDYYLSNDLFKDPSFPVKEMSNSRFIKQKDLIEDDDFNYFKLIKNKYEMTRIRSRYSRLMVKKDWVDRYKKIHENPIE